MSRNLYRRVETCFPILDERIKQRLLADDVFNYLGDEVAAWELRSDGRYVRSRGTVDPQIELLQRMATLVDPDEEDDDVPPRLRALPAS